MLTSTATSDVSAARSPPCHLQLLGVDGRSAPDTIDFGGDRSTEQSVDMRMKSVHSMPVAFRAYSTLPSNVTIHPNYGYILPGETRVLRATWAPNANGEVIDERALHGQTVVLVAMEAKNFLEAPNNAKKFWRDIPSEVVHQHASKVWARLNFKFGTPINEAPLSTSTATVDGRTATETSGGSYETTTGDATTEYTNASTTEYTSASGDTHITSASVDPRPTQMDTALSGATLPSATHAAYTMSSLPDQLGRAQEQNSVFVKAPSMMSTQAPQWSEADLVTARKMESSATEARSTPNHIYVDASQHVPIALFQPPPQADAALRTTTSYEVDPTCTEQKGSTVDGTTSGTGNAAASSTAVTSNGRSETTAKDIPKTIEFCAPVKLVAPVDDAITQSQRSAPMHSTADAPTQPTETADIQPASLVATPLSVRKSAKDEPPSVRIMLAASAMYPLPPPLPTDAKGQQVKRRRPIRHVMMQYQMQRLQALYLRRQRRKLLSNTTARAPRMFRLRQAIVDHVVTAARPQLCITNEVEVLSKHAAAATQ